MARENALESAPYTKEDARSVIIDFVKIIIGEGVLLFRGAAEIDGFNRETEIVCEVVRRPGFPDPDIADEPQARAI